MSQTYNNFCRWPSGDGHLRELSAQGYLPDRTHTLMNWTYETGDRQSVFGVEKHDQAYLGAAQVGAICSNNTYPAEPIYQIRMMCADFVKAVFKTACEKFCSLVPVASNHAAFAIQSRSCEALNW